MLTKNQIVNADDEEFMNDQQLAYMRQLLEKMRRDVLDEIELADNTEDDSRASDPLDRAQQESQWLVNIRMRSMETDLLTDIDKALHKVDCGEYGYCEFTGEPIDVRRLLAHPTSRTTVEEQEKREKAESHLSPHALTE